MLPSQSIAIGLRSFAALRYARQKKIIGLEFDRFGRHVGLRVLRKHFRLGLNYILHPVAIVRYFEFAFAASALPQQTQRCLDVSSPRLFSVYTASKRPDATIKIINPDQNDITMTNALASALGLGNVICELGGVGELRSVSGVYDCIWSLSVVEHISGDYDDIWAVRTMYNALSPGGHLILTVPVDRGYWEEYRERDYYGNQTPNRNGMYFFQRYYDEASIRERLLDPIGQHRARKRWFGEKEEGHFAEYEARWMRHGLQCAVDDPREIADHYREYESWRDMPGRGVSGITIVKNN